MCSVLFLVLCIMGSQVMGSQSPAGFRKIALVSTFGPIDAGILQKLEAAFFDRTGIIVEHQGAGTGEALKMAETGKFDLVLVHARALEEQFVDRGYGTTRFDLMYNDFVILGPPGDPAGIGSMKDAAAALRKIAASTSLFVTRGDGSGTHTKELEVWKKSGIEPRGDWYVAFQQGAKGNAATLEYANERQAYAIMDRATYITMKSKISLQVLTQGDEILLNHITLIPVNPAKFPRIHYKETVSFVEWLQGFEAQTIIRDFGIEQYGEPLFFPNSPVGRKLKLLR
jgi:tungstate transport system substrate-binding protein